jgi:mannose-1-phosphate guanylyltransferase/mannose-1-phosphate guanylyltransferase/mannose-6-phosphate isomerase
MAGGSGTRLWPASNSKKPKQFLPVARGKTETFFSLSLERALQVIEKDSGRVIIIAGKSHLPFVITACSALSFAEKKRLVLIPEPEAKNTAPAIACAVAYSRKAGDQNNRMLVLTSDHLIKPVKVFIKDVKIAADFAVQDRLVVFGITPSRPETGYGYVKAGKKLVKNVCAVDAFQEKPDQKTAKKFVASGQFFWNSGMFAFNVDFLASEFHRHASKVIRPFEQLHAPDEEAYTRTKGLRVLSNWAGLDKAYHQTTAVSFDYAVAEKCPRVVMIQAAFDWIDVGNWDEYARLLSNNSEVYIAGAGTGCFVDSDIPVALAGTDDLIVVIRSGKDGSHPAALIVKKGETQRVKEIVEQIKQAGRIEIL